MTQCGEWRQCHSGQRKGDRPYRAQMHSILMLCTATSRIARATLTQLPCGAHAAARQQPALCDGSGPLRSRRRRSSRNAIW